MPRVMIWAVVVLLLPATTPAAAATPTAADRHATLRNLQLTVLDRLEVQDNLGDSMGELGLVSSI